MDIRETCQCGAEFNLDTGTTTDKIDGTVSNALADWRAGHNHSGGGERAAKAVASSTF